MDNERQFEGGKLVLFTRSGIWQARIAIGGRRYLWRTLKTSNEGEAKRAAFKLFHLTEHKLEEGLPVQSRSFSSVLDEYEAFRERDHDLGKAAIRLLMESISGRRIHFLSSPCAGAMPRPKTCADGSSSLLLG
jgi:hypothetical protein